MTKNQWRPDTCGCILEYEFDADLPDNERVHTPTLTIRSCAFHPAVNKDTDHAVVLAENTLKNRALEEIKSKVDPSLKEEVKWEFDENRDVVLLLPESEKGKDITSKESGVIVR